MYDLAFAVAKSTGSTQRLRTVGAVQHVRRMRGGAQGHLMRCSDEHFYVVKFQNNPQHRRVLVNELVATRLAEMIGLPVPQVAVVEVGEWLIEKTPELCVQLGGSESRCPAGMQFGARFVVDPLEGHIFDYLPESMLNRVKNVQAFAGMLCLDKWTCNTNGRQAVFWKKARERNYTATFIDQGYCFNAGEWKWADAALRGVYPRNDVYAGVSGWESFEPWLSAIEKLDAEQIHALQNEVPIEWYGDLDALSELLAGLVERQKKVRGLIEMFKESARKPFPRWQD
jgi:hypothetical protein